MKFSFIIFLIGGIILLHAGATICTILGETSCVVMNTDAEEEEESHHAKKITKHETTVQACYNSGSDVFDNLSGYYLTSVICNYEANRVELPPEI